MSHVLSILDKGREGEHYLFRQTGGKCSITHCDVTGNIKPACRIALQREVILSIPGNDTRGGFLAKGMRQPPGPIRIRDIAEPVYSGGFPMLEMQLLSFYHHFVLARV